MADLHKAPTSILRIDSIIIAVFSVILFLTFSGKTASIFFISSVFGMMLHFLTIDMWRAYHVTKRARKGTFGRRTKDS